MDLSFYKNKRIFITGHTGFKGSWLCRILSMADASVTGYALAPEDVENLFEISNVKDCLHSSIIGDVRDYESLNMALQEANPEIVFHLAAQPLVRESYRNPRYTYETNVMGTVNILEAIRKTSIPPKSVVIITTDKVYYNHEWDWGYREIDSLDGYDPYSNSKSCAELVTASYVRSFFDNSEVAVSTCRAGNVIGGGDFSSDRILPDCMRAAISGQTIQVRNPYSIRPYQHVLEPLFAYLLIAQKQFENVKTAGCYNVGPEDSDCVATSTLVDLFCKKLGNGLAWENLYIDGPHEAGFLKLDCSKLKSILDWKPKWNIETAISKTVEWIRVYQSNGDIMKIMNEQIDDFLS